MFAFLKRLFGGRDSAASMTIVPAVTASSAAAPAIPPKAVSAAASQVAHKSAPAEKGVTALLLAMRTTQPVTVVAVQAAGRRVVVKSPGTSMPRAFTRRADRSYRLAGAPDGSLPELIVEAGAAGTRQRISTTRVFA